MLCSTNSVCHFTVIFESPLAVGDLITIQTGPTIFTYSWTTGGFAANVSAFTTDFAAHLTANSLGNVIIDNVYPSLTGFVSTFSANQSMPATTLDPNGLMTFTVNGFPPPPSIVLPQTARFLPCPSAGCNDASDRGYLDFIIVSVSPEARLWISYGPCGAEPLPPNHITASALQVNTYYYALQLGGLLTVTGPPNAKYNIVDFPVLDLHNPAFNGGATTFQLFYNPDLFVEGCRLFEYLNLCSWWSDTTPGPHADAAIYNGSCCELPPPPAPTYCCYPPEYPLYLL